MADIEVKNVDRLLKNLDKIKNIDVRKKVIDATKLVHAQAINLAPVNTGLLRESIHMEVKEYNNSIVGKVFTNTLYAPYVEFGTGQKGNGQYPYNLKNLQLEYRSTSWVYTPDGGDTFYYTIGQAPQPFMYPALDMNKKNIQRLLTFNIKDEINKICKGG